MINFVTEDQDWVLPRYCREFAKRMPNCQISFEPDNTADVNIFLPYYKWKPCDTPTIGFYTHKEDDTPQKKEMWDLSTQLVDYCVAMCDKTAKKLPEHKTCVIQVYPDIQFYNPNPLVIGVAGKECPSGRKRFEFIQELRKLPNVVVRFADGSVPFEQMPRWYEGIDYLVITSDNEGGSMPVIEALAMHKPVIAPDVGFTWDFSVIRYDGTLENLLEVVQRLNIPMDGWDNAAYNMMDAIEKAKLLHNERKLTI